MLPEEFSEEEAILEFISGYPMKTRFPFTAALHNKISFRF